MMCTISGASISIFFFLLFLHESTAEHNCSIDFCSTSFIPVRFPFHLQGDGQPPRCGFPGGGFNLSCSKLGGTLIRIHNDGNFIVRSIDYLNQKILIRHTNNCLAGSLLELNLIGTPFFFSNYVPFTFFTCPSNVTISRSRSTIVRCLSNVTHTVVATNDATTNSSSDCQFMGTYPVPISDYSRRQGNTSDLPQDIQLSWDNPNCRECERKGGVCGVRNSTGTEIACFDQLGTRRTSLRLFRLICFSIAVPSIVLFVAIGFFLGCTNRRNGDETATTARVNHLAGIVPEPPVLAVGLDDSTIESFTKVVLGESLRLTGPNHSVCSICLSEYLPQDILRCIPECKHCFHADCVDEWLRMNGSCPICRNSPAPSPAHADSQQDHHVHVTVMQQ